MFERKVMYHHKFEGKKDVVCLSYDLRESKENLYHLEQLYGKLLGVDVSGN